MEKDQKGVSKPKLLLILATIAALGAGGWFMWQRQNKPNNNQTNTTQPPSTPAAEEPQEPVQKDDDQLGTIKGMSTFPSEFLPEDEEICAQDTNDASKKPICTNVGKEQKTTYELKVPPGDYYVYAQTAQLPNYKAYYNEFSKCGNSVQCPDSGHKKYIKVTVAKGATVENVDPSDWYDQ